MESAIRHYTIQHLHQHLTSSPSLHHHLHSTHNHLWETSQQGTLCGCIQPHSGEGKEHPGIACLGLPWPLLWQSSPSMKICCGLISFTYNSPSPFFTQASSTFFYILYYILYYIVASAEESKIISATHAHVYFVTNKVYLSIYWLVVNLQCTGKLWWSLSLHCALELFIF